MICQWHRRWDLPVRNLRYEEQLRVWMERLRWLLTVFFIFAFCGHCFSLGINPSLLEGCFFFFLFWPDSRAYLLVIQYVLIDTFLWISSLWIDSLFCLKGSVQLDFRKSTEREAKSSVWALVTVLLLRHLGFFLRESPMLSLPFKESLIPLLHNYVIYRKWGRACPP